MFFFPKILYVIWYLVIGNRIVHPNSNHIVPHRKFDKMVGPHLRLFLILSMLPLVKSVLKEIVLIALLQNESGNKYLMLRVEGQDPNSGGRHLLPLDGAAYLKY